MNLFLNLFISALFYHFSFYSTVVGRISDKRKCADADCSEPISLATTLIRYNADDERLLSFPRNVKLKVFSKEAGDTPNFWEVEIHGKRGYVPKGLLREDKVLIPSSKLTHIVPTGRNDPIKKNNTNENLKDKESNSVNLLSATPKLPVANSKGLFSTIGGVSADSVPMNSPDIKPQSTRKFEVFEGTTLYDDVVIEKPESPPTIIDDTANEKQESGNKPPSDSKEDSHDSNVHSPDTKPVIEKINENQHTVGTEQTNGKEVDRLVAKEEDLKNEKGEDRPKQPEEDPPESSKETNLFGNIFNSVSNFISSGAGEGTTEEELEEEGDEGDEGSAEEENYEEEEENSETEGTTGLQESGQKLQSEGKLLETSHSNTSEAPSLINILDKSSLDLKPDDASKSETHDILNEGSIQNEVLTGKSIDAENNGRSADEPRESSSDNITDMEEKIEVDKQERNVAEETEEVVSEPTGIEKVESDFIQGPDLLRQENIKPQEVEILTSDTDSAFEQTSQQGTTKVVQQLVGRLKPVTDNSLEEEPVENQSNEAPESEAEPHSTEPKVQEPQNDELLVQEHLKSDDVQVQEQLKSNDVQIQEQPKTGEQQVQEEPKTDELHVQKQTKADEQEVQDQLETTTGSPLVEQTDRQFMFGSRQSMEVSPEQEVNETSETPPPLESDDDSRPHVDHNETAQVDNLPPSDPTYSSLPTFQPSGSPKYSSVVSRRIQSSESTGSELSPHSEEEENSDPQSEHINNTSESAPIHEETLSSNLLPQSQSPKYSSVVSQQIGSFAPTDVVTSETTPEAEPEVKVEYPDSADVSAAEDKSADLSAVELVSHVDVKPTGENESEEKTDIKSVDITFEDSQPPTPSEDVVHEATVEISPEDGMFSWVTSFFDVFGSKDTGIGESPAFPEDLDPLLMRHHAEESCSADGIEGSCPTSRDPMQKEVTWQESSYTSDMWDLMERVPLEATIWLVITAVVVLIFSLGHYYIEAHRRDGPLVAVINKLEREVLILKKETCILEDSLQMAQQQLETWNTSSTENDALIVELKQELEETRAAKAELEEQAAQLKDELETVTESGLEMHRLLEESLSSQDGSQVLLSTVETLREKLQRQEEEISGLSDTLSSKNAEVEELQGKLAQAGEVARSLEDRVISVTREKEEELLQLRNQHRELISQLEEVMETKALDETRLSTEMSKLRLAIEELQKTLAEKDSELDTLKEVVKQLRSTDSNEKIEALFDVVGVQAKLKTAVTERDDFREKFFEEEGARKLLEGHMMKITQEVADLKNSFETAEKEKIEALTKLQVLSNYFKEKESQLQKELGLQESMWLQKQSDDHTIYEQMRSLREENEKYKLQNESLKKEIVEQEASFKIQLANTEQKAHENWVASRQAERKLKEAQQEAAQLRNRLTTVEKNTGNYSLDEKPNISESNGDPSSPPPSLMFPPTTSPPFMMYGPPIPPPGDFVPPPPFMSSPYPSDSRPPPLGRISSPPLDHRFSPPPPLPYSPYDYSPYGHHSPSPPPPLPPHHRTVHKPQPREMSREQKDHVPNYSPDTEKTSRRNKR